MRKMLLTLVAILAFAWPMSLRAADDAPGGTTTPPATSRPDTHAKYSISTDASTMDNIVGVLRQQYHIPLCFEDVQYDPKQDIVTLKDMMDRYEEIQKHRPLSIHEGELLLVAKQQLEGGAKPDLVIDVNSERYSNVFSGNTVAEILTSITTNTPYQWKQRNGTYLVYPREHSSLDFSVSLDVTNTSLSKVVETIASQAPQGNAFSVMAVTTFSAPRTLDEATVPRLKVSDQPAIEVLCRAVEASNRRIVWSVGGYAGQRNLSLGVLPENQP